MTDEPLDHLVAAELERIRARSEAQRIHAAEQAQAAHRFKFPRAGRTLAHDLRVPPRKQRYTIDGLHPIGGNTVLTAAYKVGKTTLMGNLVKALADDEPFLGEFAIHFTGRVAYLNYELDADTFRWWMRDIGVINTDRVAAPLHLRGYTLPFWIPTMRDRTCEWLQANDVGFIIFDPTARAWHGLVDNENDNSQMGAFTNAVDELKRMAGVQDALLAAHTGRAVHLEGAERARGATRLEDWADALWYLTRDDTGTRALRATGRDVELEPTVLDYNTGTRVLSSTGQTRSDARREIHLGKALQALADMLRGDPASYPPNTRAWRAAIEGDTAERGKWMKEAVSAGYVKVEPGSGRSKLYKLTKRGGRVLLKYERETLR
jgi:hypothetical protein